MGTRLIRVAVVEDHPLYRQGLVQAVEEGGGLAMVGTFPTVGALEGAPETVIDVLLLDLHLPDCQGVAAVSRLVGRAASILVVSASADRETVVSAIAAGAKGYLSKSADSAEIRRAIDMVCAGDSYVSPQLAAFLLRDEREAASLPGHRLTKRELEILSLVADGERDADIARQLYISVKTVRSHLDRIRDKTGQRRRAQLARLALEHGRARGSDQAK